MHTCIPSCMHAYIRTYMHIFMHARVHIYMHTPMHAYLHSLTHARMHTYMHAYIHACISAYLHACARAFMHAYIHTYNSKEEDRSSSSSSFQGPVGRSSGCPAAWDLLCSPKYSILHWFISPVPLTKRHRSFNEAMLISFGSANSFSMNL
jgi:hypothetical protein